MKRTISLLIIGIYFLAAFNFLQAEENKKDTLLTASTFSGVEFRSIGPAFMSGRISDIAIHPKDFSTWYVAVGSGGVWETTNSGITWTPLFDKEKSYSTGCVTIDPNNPNTIWVGTGENVGGRHVGYGDGVYRSQDGGRSWQNMGLKESEHISKIIVHPENSNIVWIAAQGPLWNKGGERGLYKSIDGGKNWKKVLGDDEWIGVTDIVIDPRNPDLLYAATWQRRRNIASYMGGGPGSGLHKSTDSGETWEKLTKGLPGSNMGKIGLAISPQNPDVLYAAIELDRRTGGIFRSDNRGVSWQKMSGTVSGATGPHYYQELYASPHKFDRIYLVDVRMRISEDGGKTFETMKERFKHSDNHAIAFNPGNPEYLLVGTDGGLYESFDLADNWRFIGNLPVTQFYKVVVDDAKPFYNIYGGTQDNATQAGPSRTVWTRGIVNSDWYLTIGGDGHQPATEPGNPNIIYSESQEGVLFRVDVTTGERIFIQPQPRAGEDYERFNWDSPILISPHKPTRIYFASQRVWKSENRGDEWEPISGDLTKHQERFSLPIMDKTWSWDSPWDVLAMSNYNTITSLAESPLQEGLIYAGTDDGSINVTEDGGKNWKRIDVSELPGVPSTAFVNDIKADLFDANTVYAALDNHKFGDLNPYVFKSTDKGKSWKSINGNIPGRTLVWRLVQDHVNKNLLFLATEFGIYFTLDGGNYWVKLNGGVPTISFRDLAIQRRENDLVGASFGRGFYILDDYSFLRNLSEEALKNKALLYQSGKAWWYIPRPFGNIADAATFTAPNPPFGSVFTYYLKDEITTKKAARKIKEKDLIKNKKDVPFPGWDEVEKERRQDEPRVWLVIKDSEGNVIRRIEGVNQKGFHRTAWDLRYPATDAINSETDITRGFTGAMVAPGEYTVTISTTLNGETNELTGPVKFQVERLYEGALPTTDPQLTAAFWKETEDLNRSTTAAQHILRKTINKVNLMQKALLRTTTIPGDFDKELHELKQTLLTLDEQLNGNRSKTEVGEKQKPSIADRQNFASLGTFASTYGPTPEHKRSLEIAAHEFKEFKNTLEDILNKQLPKVEQALIDAGAPWIEGQPIPDFE